MLMFLIKCVNLQSIVHLLRRDVQNIFPNAKVYCGNYFAHE